MLRSSVNRGGIRSPSAGVKIQRASRQLPRPEWWCRLRRPRCRWTGSGWLRRAATSWTAPPPSPSVFSAPPWLPTVNFPRQVADGRCRLCRAWLRSPPDYRPKYCLQSRSYDARKHDYVFYVRYSVPLGTALHQFVTGNATRLEVS